MTRASTSSKSSKIVLTAEQAARRDADILRLDGLTSALSEAVADSCTGFDCRTASDRALRWIDPQDQREADLLEHGDNDLTDPAFADWCSSAKLKTAFADADAGVGYLEEIDDAEATDAVHKSVYKRESQEANSHDRLMVDVPKDGRRKGGTSGVAPELRKKSRSAKIVNEQLLRWNCSEEENAEAEVERIATNARLARKSAYVLSVYDGKNRDILELLLQSIEHREIAKIVGKSTRMIRYIVHGNDSKGRKAQPGLLEIINKIMASGVPSDFQSDAPQVVQQPVAIRVEPVKTRRKSLQKHAVDGQLAWDFDALMGVAA
ncbi:hypothetical protein HF289_10615 [Acidithiobacillus ferrooxidans]|uniref:hypothetical protein n=1 Tax=Acidithiobacillus ferrooxidans TaxID=920 RepID=UPI001C067049|nr:hypothetical protein [Acidithiobacillus ferrooxidans]MBU2857297.1 hypothetical protein [Acidithiobacillus ferrooxidans]